MKTLIVYFSQTGRTKKAADAIQKLIPDADMYEIRPVKPYPDSFLKTCLVCIKEKITKARPKLQGEFDEFSTYGRIVIGYPIWAGSVPNCVLTFLDSHNFNGKDVLPFATSSSTEMGKSVDAIRKEIPKANVHNGIKFVKQTRKADVERWLK